MAGTVYWGQVTAIILQMLSGYNLQSLNIEGVDLNHYANLKTILISLHRAQPQINMNLSIDPNNLPISLNLTIEEIEAILIKNNVQAFSFSYAENIINFAKTDNITAPLYGFKLIDSCIDLLYSTFNIRNFYPIFLTPNAVNLRENTQIIWQDPEQEFRLNSLLNNSGFYMPAGWLKSLIPELGVKKKDNKTEVIFLNTFENLALKENDRDIQVIEFDVGIVQRIIDKITLRLCQHFELSPELFEMPPYPHVVPYSPPFISRPVENPTPSSS